MLFICVATENWTGGNEFPSPEDWDNEEYTGSLADSKVFTPSSGPEPSQQPVPENVVDGAMPLPDQSQPLTLDMQPPSRPPQMPPVR